MLTHDSIGLGEDGPTHQSIEHLASLRAMPHLHVYRPADAMEVAECWELAIRRSEGPSLLVLSRQALPTMRTGCHRELVRARRLRAGRSGWSAGSDVDRHRVGGIDRDDARESLAAEGIRVAVVSLPCWELFSQQDEAYRAKVLGGAPRIGIEAACGFGWERWLGNDGVFIGMTDFGASAPYEDLYKHFGITPEAIAAAVRKQMG